MTASDGGTLPGLTPDDRVLILGYHRITGVASDPWSLSVSPALFGDEEDE